MQEIFIAALIVIAILGFYGWFHSGKLRNDDKSKHARQLDELEKQVGKLKNRHLTAGGRLPRDVQEEVGHIIAKIDMMQDAIGEIDVRTRDFKNDLIKLMNKK